MSPTRFMVAIALAVLPSTWGIAAAAEPLPLSLSAPQLQRLSGGLYRFNSQDFFERGQRQLEAEIRFLQRREQFLKDGILTISQELQTTPDFFQFERPRLVPPKPSGEEE